ncbi:MAG TPA: LLM class flavin-dependent oxidoreductase [Candidatus Dormibacteraeota bacterium]|nr:LLM class flavin-dependent oxidoreductase [Candidatus Dormibacteraeota bacterium]
MLRASLRLNNDVPVDRFARIAVLAEELGFDQLWVSHDLFWRSAPVLLTAAFASTSRIRLGAGVFNPVSLHPSEIAMVAGTLQEASGGRFLLGVGAGADRFLDWARMAHDPPVSRTRRGLVAVQALLAGLVPPGWEAEGRLRFAAPPPPVYVGAMGPRMLRMAGELADGVLPLLFPPEHFETAASQVGEGARRAGRDGSVLDVAACVWCSIDTDAARATRTLAEKIAYYGGSFAPSLLAQAGLSPADFRPIDAAMAAGDLDRACALVTPAMLALGIAGDAGDVAARCLPLLSAGARHLSFGPPLGPDPERAVRVIGTEVLPLLRARS